MVRQKPRLVTDRLILRLPEITEATKIIRYFTDNASHLDPFESKRPDDFYSASFWETQIAKYLEECAADRNLRLFLFSKEDQEVMGTLEFSQIARGPFQACYLGYGIAKKDEGTGRMHEALVAAIRYAFEDLNLHRLMANHLPENERSERLLRRLGFVRECLAKEYLQINGVWRDHVLNSLHNPHWRA